MTASAASDSPTWMGTLEHYEATLALGRRLGGTLPWHGCLALSGELGAGKTSLCRGLASGAGMAVLDGVTSPTYALVHEHETPRGPLIHVDAYRLDQVASAYALGLEEVMLRPGALVVVEWPERITPLLPPGTLHLALDYAEGGGRRFTLRAPASVLDLVR